MHVKSNSQNKFPMSWGTHRNKPHSKPLSEPSSATSPVSLGQRADGPRPTAGQSASHDPQHRASAQKHVPRIFLRWTVLHSPPDGLPFTSNFHTEPRCFWKSSRACTEDGTPTGPNGPWYCSNTVASLVGLSTWACIILYNSYKIEYNSDWCETILLISYWRSLPVQNMFAPKIIILFSSLIKYVFTLLIT